jgi:hypothetical protein
MMDGVWQVAMKSWNFFDRWYWRREAKTQRLAVQLTLVKVKHLDILASEVQEFCKKPLLQPSLLDCRMPDGNKAAHQGASSSLLETYTDTSETGGELVVAQSPMAAKEHQHPSASRFSSPASYSPSLVN